jgi:hypothetical protein
MYESGHGRRSGGFDSESSDRSAISLVDEDGRKVYLDTVVRRRRVRPEIVFVVAAAVFVAAALVKPWPSTPLVRATPSPTGNPGLVEVQRSTAPPPRAAEATEPQPTLPLDAYVPPWDYHLPFSVPYTPPPTASPALEQVAP